MSRAHRNGFELLGRRVSVDLGDRHVLRDVDFAIARGSWVGLTGPNGSGKTTLLRAIAGLLPHSGEITLAGREIRDWRRDDLARSLAFMRQATNVSFDFRVDDFVLLGRVPYGGLLGGYTRDDRERLGRVLEEADLTGFESRSVLELSGGELQRVVLAQALMQDPDVLLLDEPTAHLDVEHQFRLLAVVARRVVAGKLTVISSFHDLELAARFADTLLVLSRGSVAADGPPDAVITPGLLMAVFSMKATVERTSRQTMKIHFDEHSQNIAEQSVAPTT